MSAITGIFYRDGRSVSEDEIKKMNDLLSHRGPDGSAIWFEGPVALGHQMLHTTPESLHEKLPYEEDSLVITADARIDNRKELSEKLDLEDKEEISDSYFILKAYQKWGDECPKELLGDFAFVIWDKDNEKLFCARDHMGVKPFYYYLSDEVFFFATEIKAILINPKVNYELNEEKLAFHLLNSVTDNNLTFYKNVFTLKAAYTITVNFKNQDQNRYWKLDKDYKIILNSDEEYVQNFREIFAKAISCRLRSAFNIGFELSGGLDSSSVVCMAQKIINNDNNHQKMDINTFSMVFDGLPQVDERFYLERIYEDSDEIKPHHVLSDRISLLENIKTILWHLEEPFYTINMSILWNLYNQMRENKVRIVLSGNGGDETVISHEKNYLRDLASNMKWKQLIIEINGYSKRVNKSKSSIFFHQVFFPLIPFHITILYKKAKGSEMNKNDMFILDDEFGKKVGGKSYLDKFDFYSVISNVKTAREFHYFALNSNVIQSVLEMIDKMASAFFIEPRYPFFDKRLIEFCYAIPDNMKFRMGWNRYILRISMENILPKDIQWRPLKKYFNPVLEENLIFEKECLEKILCDNTYLSNFVDMDKLKNILNKYTSESENNNLNIKDLNKLWIVLIVYLGLCENFVKKG